MDAFFMMDGWYYGREKPCRLRGAGGRYENRVPFLTESAKIPSSGPLRSRGPSMETPTSSPDFRPADDLSDDPIARVEVEVWF